VQARDALLPQVRALFKGYTKAALVEKLERTGLPFAPIGKPEDLFDDPHLLASGGLGDVTLADGTRTQLPLLPMELDGQRPTQGGTLPAVGAHTREVLRGLGVTDAEFDALAAGKAIQ
jgi:crotonobetainyl-CoA:carnitine CoA-transferase CaiB-like acyl-CoA transferase